MGVSGAVAAWRRWRRRWRWRLRWQATRRPMAPVGVAPAVLLLVVLAGCGSVSTTPRHDLPGGVYSNNTYHLRVTYPQGWQLNVSPQSSQISPLTVLITRSGELQSTGSLVSTFAITVFDASSPPIATAVAGYARDKTLHALTLSGLPAYQATPIQQAVPNTQFSDTHTDYFLVHGDFEYQLSTDAVQGDNAGSALDSILKSFTVVS
jgi:hypothetical protein